ncbi:MAG: CPBP family intramembrane metalloprotease [Phycisphaerae bacterium]|nr:CPBP family intramembrane metalloprotease [Phycisphaerae bacterium]NIP53771.1 CPBP family intramembrane metalloprotease [Phycisphaerae bacterium]NIX29733.1 CPBP family intramembrane metalloprotease [Phycisphaerae bacterium]
MVSFLCALILALLFPELDREFPDWDMGTIFLIVVLIGPVVETLLFQALPIFVARKFNAPFVWQIVISMVIFTSLHFLEGIPTGIAAGLVGGFYFAFTYAHWREKSRWTAFWVTAISHAFNNAIAFALLALSGEL